MANYMAEISQNLGNNVDLLTVLLVALACGILLLLLLILRKAKLWYGKVDLQGNTLKEIDEKLAILETEIKEKGVLTDEGDKEQFTYDTTLIYDTAITDDTALIDDTRLAEDNSVLEQENQEIKDAEEMFCIGKSGRLYTKKELEELIKN